MCSHFLGTYISNCVFICLCSIYYIYYILYITCYIYIIYLYYVLYMDCFLCNIYCMSYLCLRCLNIRYFTMWSFLLILLNPIIFRLQRWTQSWPRSTATRFQTPRISNTHHRIPTLCLACRMTFLSWTIWIQIQLRLSKLLQTLDLSLGVWRTVSKYILVS